MKLLISAYACEPDCGSEAGVGWNCVLQAARFHEVWVLTRANNRELIESAPQTAALQNVRFAYFDLPRWARFWKRGTRGLHLYYYLWQIGAYLLARKLHRHVCFDLTHHVTFVNYWQPSLLPLLPMPFLWGPVGGGESVPAAFEEFPNPKHRLYEALRDVARIRSRVDPFVIFSAHRAALALATTEDTRRKLQSLGCNRVVVASEAALTEADISRLAALPPASNGAFRLLSVGRLLHWKGFALAIRAFGEFQGSFPASEYWIVGNGPERESLGRLAADLGLQSRVKFLGRLPRAEVLEKLAQCHALAHPSLHDSGGWVCLEAMAAGRPVVCLDLGGPALQVTTNTGIKVAAIEPRQTVRDLRSAFARLAANPPLCAQLGQEGRQRVRTHFCWETKGEFYRDISEAIVDGRPQARHSPRLLRTSSAEQCGQSA